MLDLRLPIGWFFTITGVLLLAMGFRAGGTRSLTAVNVDLYCGLFITIFGAILPPLSARAARRSS